MTSNLPFNEWTENLRLRTVDWRAARPADPSRPHPRAERRQLSPRTQQGKPANTLPSDFLKSPPATPLSGTSTRCRRVWFSSATVVWFYSALDTDGFEYDVGVIARLFGSACGYGHVLKTRRNDRVVRVERRRRIGTAGRLKVEAQAWPSYPSTSEMHYREPSNAVTMHGGSSCTHQVLPSSSVGEESLSPNHPDTSSRF